MKDHANERLKKAPDAFCIYPFTHITFGQGGKINLCCRSSEDELVSNLANIEADDIWNGKQFKAVRHRMLNNVRPPECESCWKTEKFGVKSYRQEAFDGYVEEKKWFNEAAQFDPDTGISMSGPQSLKIYLSSLCNLQCRMCNSDHSTKWERAVKTNPRLKAWLSEADLKSLTYDRPNPLVSNYQDKIAAFVEKHVQDLRQITFVGGEPLMSKEHLKIMRLLEGHESKIKLLYDTNLTTLKAGSEPAIDRWERFKEIQAFISVDGPPAVFEYVRIGLDSSAVEENLKVIRKKFNTDSGKSKVLLFGTCTFSVYNVLFATEAAKYITRLGLRFISNLVEFPYFLSAQILPAEEKALASQKIRYFLADIENQMAPHFDQNSYWVGRKDRRADQVRRTREGLLNVLRWLNGEDKSEHFSKFLEFDEILNEPTPTQSIYSLYPSWRRYSAAKGEDMLSGSDIRNIFATAIRRKDGNPPFSSAFLEKSETTLDYFKPKVMPIVWETGAPLHPSMADGLKTFYNRTPFFEVAGTEQLIGPNVDELLRKAAQSKTTEWAAVIGMGNIYASQKQFVDEIEKFLGEIKKETLVAGHLINKSGFYCGLHEQFFLVNLRVYEKLGCPHFGEYRQGNKNLHNYVAGDSVHDDYTPKWLEPRAGRSNYQTGTCGWGLVNASMEAGLTVLNIPDSLRSTKVYLYPDNETEKLNKNIDLIYQLEDLSNPTQRVALAHLLLKRLNITAPISKGSFAYRERGNCLFFFNSEGLLPEENWVSTASGPMDVYAGPCSGFQDIAFCKAVGMHEGTEIIYYDINSAAIEMKKYILGNFSGWVADLPAIIAQVRKDFPNEEIYTGPIEFKLKELLFYFDKDEKTFHDFWKKFVKIKKTFNKINLLTDHSRLTSSFRPDQNVVLNLTDIYLGQNEVVRGMHKMKDLFHDLHKDCSKVPNLFLTGQSLNQNRFFGAVRDLDLDRI